MTVLLKEKVPEWTADQQPLYDIDRSFQDNLELGPFFDSPLPERRWAPQSEWVDFLGTPVASRLGIPAGPLMSSPWVALSARLGFDTLVYKTMRSHPFPAHPLPNITYVDAEEPIEIGGKISPLSELPKSLDHLGITNSFGNPTQPDIFLARDIPAAMASLQPGQAFVASVVGVPQPGVTMEEDFCLAARHAVELGAPIIEANFSCPNVNSADGALYQSPDAFSKIGSSLVDAIGNLPLIIKMGYIADDAQLEAILTAAARAGVRAISAINTIKMHVVDKKGRPALGRERPTSGICGGPIRPFALDFIGRARGIIDREKLNLTLIGVGGITHPDHFDEFFNQGADFAQVATGMMWDPYLAIRYHNRST